jgi:hypothetical protein
VYFSVVDDYYGLSGLSGYVRGKTMSMGVEGRRQECEMGDEDMRNV